MRVLTIPVLLVLLLGGCREADGPIGPGGGGRLYITSEPSGATIVVDGRDTGHVTPDTVGGLAGIHDVQVRLDSAGIRYEYNVRITVLSSDSVRTLHGPLALQCTFSSNMSGCYRDVHRYQTAAGVRFATNPLGSIFLYDGSGQGAFWPATSANSYLSAGIPIIAALAGNEPVAIGMYDHAYLAGRPAPSTTVTGGRTALRQRTWIVPPTSLHLRTLTMRGIEIEEEIITDNSVSDVVLIKLSFRNITHEPDYQAVDPYVPVGGITYTDAFVGMALDPDIGDSGDDWLSYDAELDMAFAYDARFSESAFINDAASPALVGLRALRAPPGTTVILNGWTNQGVLADWTGGTVTEPLGFDMLSGRAPYPPDHASPRIGHLPGAESDMRISVTAGPVQLAPNARAEIVLAVAFARPTPGTFTTGALVAPGDPENKGRALYSIASQLRQRLQAAAALVDD